MTEIKPALIIKNEYDAAFDIATDTIHYQALLDKYPALKNKIIKHELCHAKKPRNILWHVWIDIRDYPKLIWTDEYIQYMTERDKQFEPYDSKNLGFILLVAIIYYPIISLLNLIISIGLILIKIHHGIFRKKRTKQV